MVNVQPFVDAEIVRVDLTLEPVLLEWTVKPTTIADEYEITLHITLVAKIPTPSLFPIPDWAPVPHEVDEEFTDFATVLNPGLIALRDVRVELLNAPGISLLTPDLGEMPPESAANINYRVSKGDFSFLPDTLPSKRALEDETLPMIKIVGTYTVVDKDTLLPQDASITAYIPFVNPTKRIVTFSIPDVGPGKELTTILAKGKGSPRMPGEPKLPGFKLPKEGEEADETLVLVKIDIPQKAMLEREAFDANLKMTNGYTRASMDSLAIEVRVEDMSGKDVTSQFSIVPPELFGISDVEGGDSLGPLETMTGFWQLIPGDGLGGTNADTGEDYFAKAIITYFVSGRLVQNETEAVKITVHPQPNLKLHYYLSPRVFAFEPFKLGIEVENVGDGWARNLRIESGQPRIVENESGLAIDIQIIQVSFGESTEKTFTVHFGDIPPHSKVSGYWLIESNVDADVVSFTADMTHKLFKGIELSPLITSVETHIIERDDVVLDPSKPDETYSLIDRDDDGFPDYFNNLASGLRLPLTVPPKVEVVKRPTQQEKTLRLEIPPTPDWIVVVSPDVLPDNNISAIWKLLPDGTRLRLGIENTWKARDNVYFIHRDGGLYEIDYRSALEVRDIEFSPLAVYESTIRKPKDGGLGYAVFFETGILPNAGELTRLRARIFNNGLAKESAIVSFYDILPGSEVPVLIGRTSVSAKALRYAGSHGKLPSLFFFDPVIAWTPLIGGEHTIRVEVETDSPGPKSVLEHTVLVNSAPVADAGFDRSGLVGQPILLDGSRSYDSDGHIVTFFWDFDDEVFGAGVTPSHIWERAGTYNATLEVKDNNGSKATSTILVAVDDLRPDLVVESLSIFPEVPDEDQPVTVSATVRNIGVSPAEGPIIVGFYVNDQYFSSVRIFDAVTSGEAVLVTFDWVAPLGNHRLAVFADDLEDRIDEVDEENNERAFFLRPNQIFFPDLTLDSLEWSEASGGVPWGKETTFTATVRNNGTRESGPFNVAFYLDGSFMGRSTVQALTDVPSDNIVNVTFPWVPQEGLHTIAARADAPIPNVVELDEANNETKLTLPDISILYPDLRPTELRFTPADGRVRDGGNLQVTTLVANHGDAEAPVPFEVALYVDGNRVGVQTVESLRRGGSVPVRFEWQAVAGLHGFEIRVDEPDGTPEKSEDNNALAGQAEITILLPDLEPLPLQWTPELPTRGDYIEFVVRVRNAGAGPTQGPFVVTLDVAGRPALSLDATSTVPAGGIVTLTGTWQATLRTDKPYTFSVHADSSGLLREEDESNNTATSSSPVMEGLVLRAASDRPSYLEGDLVALTLTAAGSDDPAAPLAPQDGVAVTTTVLRNGVPLFEQAVTSSTSSAVWARTLEGLSPGDYDAVFAASWDMGRRTVTSSADVGFTVVKDFAVTIDTELTVYKPGQRVKISGTVADLDGAPIPETAVLLQITNSIGRNEATTTDALGRFGHVFQPALAEGGNFTTNASVEIGGIVRSTSTVFAIVGLAVFPSERVYVDIPKGGSREVTFRTVNVGAGGITFLTIEVLNDFIDMGVDARLVVPPAATQFPGQEAVFTIDVTVDAESPLDSSRRAPVVICVNYNKPQPCAKFITSIQVTVVPPAPAYSLGDLGISGDPSAVKTTILTGGVFTKAILIGNSGSAPLSGLEVTVPAIPWVTAFLSGPATVNPGQTDTRLLVTVAPPVGTREGVYRDKVQVDSNAGQRVIDVEVTVLDALQGSVEVQVRDEVGGPVPGAAVTVFFRQPLAFGPKQTLVPEGENPILVAATNAAGVAVFTEIPTGTYFASVSADFYETLAARLDVFPALDDVQRAVFTLTEKEVEYTWSLTSIRPATSDEREVALTADPAANPALVVSLKDATITPVIQTDYPALEYSILEGGVVEDSFLIRNPHTSTVLQAVTVTIVPALPYEQNGEPVRDFPHGALKLGNGGGELVLGALRPGETRPVHLTLDLDAFPRGEGHLYERRLLITATWSDGKEEMQVATEVPVRAINPPPEGTVNVTGGISAQQRQLRQSTLQLVPGLALPRRTGDVFFTEPAGDLEVIEEEALNLALTMLVPVGLEGLSVTPIISSLPLDAGGGVPGGGLVMNPVVSVTFKTPVPSQVAAGSTVPLAAELVASKGASDLVPLSPVYLALAVTYRLGGDEFSHVWRSNSPITILQAPKLFLSESIEPTGEAGENRFLYTVIVTNVAERGRAKDVEVEVRQISAGTVKLHSDTTVGIGIMLPGDSRSATFEVEAAKVSDIREALSPTVLVGSSASKAVKWRFGAGARFQSHTIGDLTDLLYELQDSMELKVENDKRLINQGFRETVSVADRVGGVQTLISLVDQANSAISQIGTALSSLKGLGQGLARAMAADSLREFILKSLVQALANEVKEFLTAKDKNFLLADSYEAIASLKQQLQRLDESIARTTVSFEEKRDNVEQLEAVEAALGDILADPDEGLTSVVDAVGGADVGAAESAAVGLAGLDVASDYADLIATLRTQPPGTASGVFQASLAAVATRLQQQSAAMDVAQSSLDALQAQRSTIQSKLDKIEQVTQLAADSLESIVDDAISRVDQAAQMTDAASAKAGAAIPQRASQQSLDDLYDETKQFGEHLTKAFQPAYQSYIDLLDQKAKEAKDAILQPLHDQLFQMAFGTGILPNPGTGAQVRVSGQYVAEQRALVNA